MYRAALNISTSLFGVARVKKFDSRFRFHRQLDLKNPKTLSDKICWIELNTDQTLAARCTDKFAVRSYIEEKGLGDIIIPLVGGPWIDASEIDLDALPKQFVIKATHGCEMNYICKDIANLDCADLIRKVTLWLKEDYPRACLEPHYRLVPHRIYAEEYLSGLDDVIDYKIHCINGEPVFILTCSNREDSLKLNLYDLDWNPLNGIQGSKKNIAEINRPANLDRMIEVARILSSDFDFVRVDLYEQDEKVRFGELTFSPACGVLEYFTDSFVRQWGEVLHVKELGY